MIEKVLNNSKTSTKENVDWVKQHKLLVKDA